MTIAYNVNSYVWELLQQKLDWEKITTKELVPILPARQQPEVMNTDKPHIIYAYSGDYNDGSLEPADRVTIFYLVYGKSTFETGKVVELLKNAFKAEESAHNINNWTKRAPRPEIPVDQRDWTVTYTEVMNTESPDGPSEEGGKVDGLVTVRVGYHASPGDYSV